jgi:hypothetical protein
MKTILSAIILCFFTLTINAQDSINATWDMGKENTHISIQETEGKVVSSDKTQLVGKVLLKDIKADGNHYTAQIFVLKKKKWYKAKIQPEENKLLVTVKVGLMSKTLTWLKVE